MREEEEIFTAECPECCFSCSSADESRAEERVDNHMRDKHPELTRYSTIKIYSSKE